MSSNDTHTYPWLWDVPISDAEFDAIVGGGRTVGLYDREWAALRLIEYAPYRDIRRLLPDATIRELWPSLAPKVRSATRRAGMHFLYEWLTKRAA